MQLTAVEVRTRFLKIIDELRETHDEITITKRGKPVAKLTPLTKRKLSFGLGKGLGRTVGDIVENDWSEDWESLS